MDNQTPAVDVDASVDTSKRVVASNKRMINAETDVNQLVPFKYTWAWDMYLAACANNWMPQETDIKLDAEQWAGTALTSEERHLVARLLATIIEGDGRGAGTTTMSVYRHLTAPEARQYLLRQGFEEVLMTHVYLYVQEAFPVGLPQGALQQERQALLKPYTELLHNPTFSTSTTEDAQAFLVALVAYAVVYKGLFGLLETTQLLGLDEVKLPGLKALFRNIARDAVMQCQFGIEVVEAIKTENPALWTPSVQAEVTRLIHHAVDLELRHLPPHDHGRYNQYLKIVANRRLHQIGLPSLFPSAKNPFPWMGKLLGLRADDAAFETHKVESKTNSTLDWE